MGGTAHRAAALSCRAFRTAEPQRSLSHHGVDASPGQPSAAGSQPPAAGCAPASPARLPGAGGLSCSQRGKTHSIPTRESSAPRRPAHLRAGAGAQRGAAACKLPPQENRSQGSAVHSRELPHRDGKSARVGLHVPRAAGAACRAVGQTCCSAHGAPGPVLVKAPSFFKRTGSDVEGRARTKARNRTRAGNHLLFPLRGALSAPGKKEKKKKKTERRHKDAPHRKEPPLGARTRSSAPAAPCGQTGVGGVGAGCNRIPRRPPRTAAVAAQGRGRGAAAPRSPRPRRPTPGGFRPGCGAQPLGGGFLTSNFFFLFFRLFPLFFSRPSLRVPTPHGAQRPLASDGRTDRRSSAAGRAARGVTAREAEAAAPLGIVPLLRSAAPGRPPTPPSTAQRPPPFLLTGLRGPRAASRSSEACGSAGPAA